jgi:restriction endonuclease S subunit
MSLAAIVGDIDADSATIEATLAKPRQIKQGRMQKLLGRKVRSL